LRASPAPAARLAGHAADADKGITDAVESRCALAHRCGELAAAHAAGIRVVGWYVPDYADLTRDVRRTLAITGYVSPAGHRFDAIGVDVEYPLNVPDPSAWNQAVADHLARARAGTSRPIAAIVLPWAAVGRYATGVAPMSYWTSFTAASRCAAGDLQYCAYQYTRDNVLLSRHLTAAAGWLPDRRTR
jgi:hypothetical protein